MNDWLHISRATDAERLTGTPTHAGDLLKLESATDTLLLESSDKMLLETMTNG